MKKNCNKCVTFLAVYSKACVFGQMLLVDETLSFSFIQDSFKNLWQQITTPRTGLEFITHRIRLRTYSTCFVGRDLIDWLMVNRKAPNRYCIILILAVSNLN